MAETTTSAKENIGKNPKKNLRVEQQIIKSNHPYFSLFADFSHKAKNLYNHANFLVRQEFINNGKWLRFQDLDKLLKNDFEYPDYKDMGLAQSAQQTLRQLDDNWKGFFASIKIGKRTKLNTQADQNFLNIKRKTEFLNISLQINVQKLKMV